MKNRIRIVVSVLLFSLMGCGTVEKVRDVEFVTHNNFKERFKSDSVLVRDSVLIREKSDTVFYTKYRTVYKERLRVDTVVRCDTIYRDREVIVERVRDATSKMSLLWKLPLAVLLIFLLWRTGLWRVLWNLILKGVRLCIKIFHLKE
jgi:hypothetical protein